MRFSSATLIVVSWLFCIAFLAPAQTTAAISGIISDPSGAVVSGADVLVKNIGIALERKTVSDSNGLFRIASLDVGRYQVTVVKPGFKQQVRTGITLVVGQEALLNFHLPVGQSSQTVTVSADAPLVNPTTANVADLISEKQIETLPLNGRSFDLLLTLDPGVVNFTSQKVGGVGVSNSTAGNNFAVSGNRPQQNIFLLNGIEFTGAAENNMQPGGVSQLLLGVDAVREFNVLTNNYDAQYGKRPGAQVSIVTRSGSDEFHGALYEFIRNNALDARNFFDASSAPGFQRNQFGAALGGPLKRNKTFFFTNFEGLDQHLHQTGVDLVPDSKARNGLLTVQDCYAHSENLLLVRLGFCRSVFSYKCLAGTHTQRPGFWRNLGSAQ